MRRCVAIAGSTLLLLWVTTGVVRVLATAPTYTVEDLGTTTDGYVPSVTGINTNGQVSGTAATAAGQRPVRFTSGVGFEYLAGVDTSAGVGNAINDIGEVAGYTLTSAGQRAYSTGAGTLTIVAPATGGTFTFGWGINALGVIAGYANTSAGLRAFRDTPGAALEVLPTLGGSTLGFGINDNGQVVGASTNSGGVQHAFRANPDGTIDDLGSLSATGGSIATAIDKKGDVVGRSLTAASVYHAFRYTDHMEDIDTLGSTLSNATAVSGPITVGTFTAADKTSHAFMHTAVDGMVDLNTRIPADSGWVLMSATGVNSNGQIVGMGLLNGVQRAYRLTPDKPADTTPPVITSISATPPTITPADLRTVAVTMSVTATDDSGDQPVCKLVSITGPGASPTDFNVTSDATGTVRAVGGRTYTFNETCTDAAGNPASASTDVVVPPDTTPPTITSMSATPSSIWPPIGNMVTVTVSVAATDDADPSPVCSLASISGGPSSDESVTGQFTGSVKAVGGRTYVLTATCSDFSSNKSQASVNVVVPPDVTAPTINSVTASPASIWPPISNMVTVTVSVSATDDVDPSPACSLLSITGPGVGADRVVTGQFTGSVKAVGGRTYAFNVGCSDFSGNKSQASVNVVVPPDVTAPAITSIGAAPGVIWPPNGRMVPVTISVTAVDDVDPSPSCSVSGITANGGTAADWAITGSLTASVRAEKNWEGTTRAYVLQVTCSDFSGNMSAATTTVIVSKDGTATFTKKPLMMLLRGRAIHRPALDHDRDDRDRR